MILQFVTKNFEKTLNYFLNRDLDAQKKLKKIAGKVVAIEIKDLNLKFYFVLNPAHILIGNQYAGEVDVLIAGKSLDLIRAWLRSPQAQSLDIIGSTELANDFNQFLKNLDVDFEEILANITGDHLAYHIGRVVRIGQSILKNQSQKLQQDLKNYIQEEARLSPSQYEVEIFYADVAKLRNHLERLQQKIELLKDLP